MSTNYLTSRVLSHAQRVKRLYKQSLRATEAYYISRHKYLYQAALMRQRFDENKHVVDLRAATTLLKDGEEELFWKSHEQPIKFVYSPGGIGYEREHPLPDGNLDMWHPLERAQYPEYFARRHQRKLEFIERYEKKYGKQPLPQAEK